jgi:hypothetical protein
MGGKPANLNSVIKNQDSDTNLQLALGDVLTRQIVCAFKSDQGVTASQPSHASSTAAQAVVPCQTPARSRSDFSTFPDSKNSRATALAARECFT